MTADVHALTGAYVLDAVSELERAAFERHLAECDACAQEVRELRDTAARLGSAAAAEPPPELKSRVLARISEVRQLPPYGDEVPATRHRRRPEVSRWALRLTSAAAAVLLIAATVLGVLLVRERSALDETRQQAAALVTVLQADDAKLVTGTAGDATAAAVVSRSQGRMLLLANGLPELPSEKVYQAWLVDGSGQHSAGVFPRESTPNGVRLDVNGVGSAQAVAVTVEPVGGSELPTSQPVMQMDLPA